MQNAKSRFSDRLAKPGSKYFNFTNLAALIVVGLGVYLAVSLISQLISSNYNYHGTHYDFIAFYSAATAVLHSHSQQLYNASYIRHFQRQIIPHPIGASGYMPYLNPPFVAVLLCPLGLMNINAARLVWLVISLVTAVYIVYQLTPELGPRHRWLAGTLLLLTFPMYQDLVEGQLSLLVLLGGVLAYLFLKRSRQFLAGASLVLLWVIPQFGVFAFIGLVIKRQWSIIKGWIVASLALLLVSLPITGLRIYFRYIRVLASVTGDHFANMSTSSLLTWRGSIDSSSGLNGLYNAIFGQGHTTMVNMLYAVSAALLVVLLIRTALVIKLRLNGHNGALIYVAGLLSALLIDPNLFAQDILVAYMLLPAIYILSKRNRLQAIMIFTVVCDLAFVDQYSRLHLSTIVAVAAIIACLNSIVSLKHLVSFAPSVPIDK